MMCPGCLRSNVLLMPEGYCADCLTVAGHKTRTKPKEPSRPYCSKCGAFTYDLYMFDDKALCGECAYGEDSEFVEECEKKPHNPCPLCGCQGAK